MSRNKSIIWWTVLAVWTAHAQTPVSQTVEIWWNREEPAEAVVHQSFVFDQGKSGPWELYNWLEDYADIHSELGRVLAGRYRLDFHFSSAKQRGYLHIDSLNVPATWTYKEGITRLEWNDTVRRLQIYYRIRLPDRRFTGMGFDKEGYDLQNVFLQPVVAKNEKPLHYDNIILFDRPLMRISSKIIIHNASGWQWQFNGDIRENLDSLRIFLKNNNRWHLAARRQGFRIFSQHGHRWILDPEVYDSYPDTELALAVDKVYNFLETMNFPLARQVMITSLDKENFPVFDVDWLPVIKPFPADFRLAVEILYQSVRQSLAERPRDYRRDYAFWTGLEQWYVLRFVRRYYPEMRMTGLPVRWPVVRSYRMFKVPYEHKYYLLYRYIGRLNYDQALHLSAGQLSNFNRRVGTPSKSLLGWQFLDKYAKGLMPGVLERMWHSGDRQWLTPSLFDHYWKEAGGPDISFLWNDFYTSARKIDFGITRRRVEGQYFWKIRNLSGMSFPVILDSSSSGVILFHGSDTLLPVAKTQRKVELNHVPLYPEINLRNNTAPFWRKPLQIRFWQDMEAPFHTQIFLNPEFAYNLYDGFILGLGINNKTFIDKRFTWQIRPSYAFHSKSLTGQADFRYIRRYVRPYLFGWSVGGYMKRYHYDFGRWYTTGSLFARLSFKDRAHAFMKGQDWGAEYLFVDKEAPRQHPETAHYAVGMLSHKWEMRGLLKRYAWESDIQFHRAFVKLESSFGFRSFIDKYRQIEWRTYVAWMPYNKTQTDYFSLAFTRPTDYLFKYPYYGRSETSGLFYQQYVYAEGGFKVFYPQRFVNRWMFTNNLNIGIYKRLNLFADFGWGASYGSAPVFHYDTGIRFYLVPDYFEFYFPLYSDLGFPPFDKTYWQQIRIMFVFDMKGLFRMFSRSWY